jgi:hypothetical protein
LRLTMNAKSDQSAIKKIALRIINSSEPTLNRSTRCSDESTPMVVGGESSRSIKPFSKETHDQLMVTYETAIGKMDVEKVMEAVSCLIEIYHLFGLERLKHTDTNDDQKRYRLVVLCAAIRCLEYMSLVKDPKSWIPYFKYKTCAFYAAFEKQDIPPPPKDLLDPNPKIIFGGYVGSWVKLLKKKNSSLYESFALTINMAKMGMPRADESMIKAAEIKCATHLTTAPAVFVDHFCDQCGMSGLSSFHLANCNGVEAEMYWGNGIVIDKESMMRELRRTVQELFVNQQYTEKLHYEPFFPSTSANYIRSRNKCGAVGIVSQIIQGLGLFDPNEDLVATQLVASKLRSKLAEKYGVSGIVEQAFNDIQTEIGKLHVGKAVEYDGSLLKAKWAMVMDKIKELAWDEVPLVQAVGLAEALKIRVISKGPPLLYTLLVPLQKFMWSVLKENKVFKLISGPISVEHVKERIGIPTDEEIIVNGDYKASTDNLHSWVSECIGLEIVEQIRKAHQPGEGFEFDDRHKDMFIRSLIHHQYIVDDVVLPQLEGQLMGSVTSFPVLCIANAAMCRWALEAADNKRYRLCDRPYRNSGRIASLLVNGDDCTLKGCRANLRQIWERITAFGGLSTSVGKTLFSRIEKPICVLNSTTFHLIEGEWQHIRFINMGIVLGKARSGNGKEEKRGLSQMGSLHRQLKLYAPEGCWKEISQRFIYYNRETLNLCPDIPWNVPEYLGGAGLVSKEPMSLLDRTLSTLIINRMKVDNRYEIRKEKIDAMWVVHDVVKKRLDNPVFKEASFGYRELRRFANVDLSSDFIAPEFKKTEDEYSRFYKYLTVETLFRNPVKGLFNIVVTKEDKLKAKVRANDIQKHNEYVRRKNNSTWINARNEFKSYTHIIPREESEIMYEKRDPLMACIAVPTLVE